ncbi:hypothetical protein ACS0TY_016106 [Phlomoides rotata]
MNSLLMWPEPVIPVQRLSESGITRIPNRYVKKPSNRPVSSGSVNIPVTDMKDLESEELSVRRKATGMINSACREWGFFQVVNHGVSHELMARSREAWRGFFVLRMEEKLSYANKPSTYEGYGSRLGVEKGISLDWSDYFYLHWLPVEMRDHNKWPSLPVSCRFIYPYVAQVRGRGGGVIR